MPVWSEEDFNVTSHASPQVELLPQDRLQVVADAQRVAERLVEAVSTLLDTVPVESRTAAGLARLAGIERTVVQRLISGVASHGLVSPELLTRVPGSKAIMSIADALLGAGVAQASGLRAAAEELNSLFLRSGGTQKAFTRALQVGYLSSALPSSLTETAEWSKHSEADDPHLSRRISQFRNARELVRAWSATHMLLHICAPARSSPDKVDALVVRGVVNYQTLPGAVPLIFHYGRLTRDASSADIPPLQAFSSESPAGVPGILPGFSSEPLPTITPRVRPRSSTYIIERSAADQSAPFDLFLAHQLRGILEMPGPKLGYFLDQVWMHMSYPAEGLIFDSYRHRSMAKKCIPGLDTHLWMPAADDTLESDRWATRLRVAPDLTVLSGGLEKAASPLYRRQRELTAEAFRLLGHDPDDFVGFRCEQRFPEWRVGYRMYFDYSDTDEQRNNPAPDGDFDPVFP